MIEKFKLENFNNKYTLNLSFDQEIQKMVITESSGSENLLIRSKSENQIGSFVDFPSYEQFHSLIQQTQPLIPCPTTISSVPKKKKCLSGRFGRSVVHSDEFKIGKPINLF